MSLVNLNHKLSVNPQFVQSVQCKEERRVVAIKMHDGTEHDLLPEYNEKIFETYDRVIHRLNGGTVQ